MTKSSTTPPRHRGRTLPKRQDRRWLWALILVGVVLLVGTTAALRIMRQAGGIAGLETFGSLPQGHQQGEIAYPQTPPAGGPHNPAWQNCGIYNQPIQKESGVHSLEHGAVWITYRPDLPSADIEQLKAVARSRRFVLLSPFPDLPAPVVASAWGLQVKVENASDPRIEQFAAKYVQGSQTPELGASCTGGIGTPSGS